MTRLLKYEDMTATDKAKMNRNLETIDQNWGADWLRDYPFDLRAAGEPLVDWGKDTIYQFSRLAKVVSLDEAVQLLRGAVEKRLETKPNGRERTTIVLATDVRHVLEDIIPFNGRKRRNPRLAAANQQLALDEQLAADQELAASQQEGEDQPNNEPHQSIEGQTGRDTRPGAEADTNSHRPVVRNEQLASQQSAPGNPAESATSIPARPNGETSTSGPSVRRNTVTSNKSANPGVTSEYQLRPRSGGKRAAGGSSTGTKVPAAGPAKKARKARATGAGASPGLLTPATGVAANLDRIVLATPGRAHPLDYEEEEIKEKLKENQLELEQIRLKRRLREIIKIKTEPST